MSAPDDPDPRRPGYRLRPGLLWIDTEEFSALCADADKALDSGDLTAARTALATATALRRGPAYADVSHVATIAGAAGRLEESWLLAAERRMQVELSLGQAAGLAGGRPRHRDPGPIEAV